MTTVWTVIGIGVAAALFVIVAVWWRRDQLVDLGAVSHHWIAEHRQGQDGLR